jgi:hypothetical protein
MANVIERFRGVEPVTCHAAAALTGGRFVRITAAPNGGNPTVNVPAAGGRTFGIAAQDVASGGKVTVIRPGGLVQVEAGATLAPQDLVESNASGQAIVRAAGIPQGEVVEGATSGNLALIHYEPALL